MDDTENQTNTAKGQSELTAVVSCFAKVFEAINADMQIDFTYWQIVEIVDRPKGEYQINVENEFFDHEYVDHRQIGPEGDSFTGSIYFPVGDGRYIRVYFDS